jgi:hypothetical protein
LHDQLPPVPYSDTIEHSVRRGAVCAFSGFHMLFTSDDSSTDFQISQTLMSLGFGILLLLRWILLAFSMLILWVVGLIERAPLGLVIFLDLLSFASLFENSLQLHSPPSRSSM